MSLLVIFEIFGLFVTALPTDKKFFLRNCKNLQQPIQMQFSEKQNTFSQFFTSFLKFRPRFHHFEKKGDAHSSSYGIRPVLENSSRLYILKGAKHC